MIADTGLPILLPAGRWAWCAVPGAPKNRAMRAENGFQCRRLVMFAQRFAAFPHALQCGVFSGRAKVLMLHCGGITKLGYGGAIVTQPIRHIRNSR